MKKDFKARFLETVTFLGNDVLVPINSIRCITCRIGERGSYQIAITGEGEWEWVEHFEDSKKCDIRYKMIKEIIGAK